MDGGGRLLRSLTETAGGLFAFARPRLAGLPGGFETAAFQPQRSLRSRTRTGRSGFWRRRALRGGPGVVLALVLLLATGLYGTMRNGQYAAFVETYGAPGDVIAKALGFPIKAITISGPKALDPREILAAAGINPRHSLLFLNPAEVRDRLKAIPLVRDAVVTKLYPNRLTITLDERDPVALWQIDGKLSIVSGDGVVIDDVHDDRFIGLPFVVGEGANAKVGEFLALLDAAGELRSRVTAGMLVGDRRWTLKMDNGVQVELPEVGAAAAVAQLVALEGQSKLIDKDVVAIDLRIPGRLTARLSDDAAAARAAMLAKKTKAKGTTE